ncbi:unnamed protein product [Diplocarpon coronariae]
MNLDEHSLVPAAPQFVGLTRFLAKEFRTVAENVATLIRSLGFQSLYPSVAAQARRVQQPMIDKRGRVRGEDTEKCWSLTVKELRKLYFRDLGYVGADVLVEKSLDAAKPNCYSLCTRKMTLMSVETEALLSRSVRLASSNNNIDTISPRATTAAAIAAPRWYRIA